MKPRFVSFVLCLFAALAFAPFSNAQDSDPDVAAALKQAEEQAKKMGIKMPDMKAQMAEIEEDEANEKAGLQKQLNAPGAVEFPASMPKVPDFKPDGPPAKKIVDEEVQIIQTGTSPRTPAELGDAWETKETEGMSRGRSNNSINDTKTVIMYLTTQDDARQKMRLEATRSPKDKLTRVTISSPLPKPDETAASEPETPAAAKPDLPAGSAKGSLTFDGATAELKFAAAFIEQKDERKPVVVILSDQKLPAEKWTSSLDIMMDKTKWDGVAFFFDKEGTVFRWDVHMKGRQTSVGGYWDAKIDKPESKDVTGNVKTTNLEEKENRLDVTFHAALK